MTPDQPAQFELDDRGLPVNYRFMEGWELTPRQVRAALDAGDELVLLDCRTPAEHQLVHLPGSVLIPIQEAPQRLNELQSLADRKVVVYCHHGVRSLRMTSFLRQQGWTNVHSMAGGIDLWAVDIEPGMTGY